MKNLNSIILEWQNSVDMENKGHIFAQANKFIEEFSELRLAICNNDLNKIKDSIGDVYISLLSLRLVGGKGVEATRYLFDREIEYSSSMVSKLNILKFEDRFLILDIMSSIEIGVLSDVKKCRDILAYSLNAVLILLNCIAEQYRLSLKDCVEYAIDTVRCRKYVWHGNILEREVVGD